MRADHKNSIWRFASAVFAIILAASGAFAADDSPNATGTAFEYPAGPPAEIARAFVAAFNAGDESAMADFCTTHQSETALEERSLKSQLYQFGGLCRMLGTISPFSVTDRSSSKIVLLVRSEKLGTWFNVGVEMDKNQAGKASHVYVRPAPPPEMIGRS
ncbi:MAG: hypothetical protein P8181_07235 [bacterium]